MAVIEKQLKIAGMFCTHCQSTIQRGLRKLNGVQAVSVSNQTGDASITYDPDRVSLREIEETIQSLGYEVLPDAQTDLTRTVSLLGIIISLYVILQQFGVLNLLVPSQLAESGMGYGMLFLVGLFTSVHCIAMCGGINLSQSLPQTSPDIGRIAVPPSLFYNLGRVVSYTAIGFLLGLAGLLLGGGSGTGIPVLLQGILKIIAGIVMVVMGVNMLGIFPWLRRWNPHLPEFLPKLIGQKQASARRPLAVGLLNGLMPCGPLQSMQILALASGNPAAGALSMLLFSLGTVPLMLGLGTLVSALGRRFARTVINTGAVLVAVLGLAMLSQGGALSGMLLPDRLLVLVIGLAVIGIAASVPFSRKTYRYAAVALSAVLVVTAGLAWQRLSRDNTGTGDSTVQIVDGVQIVDSTLAPGQYPTIMVQSGLPVRWTIHAPEGSINGCNYQAVIREYGITHTFTEGDNLIEFTPAEAGTVPYSCWMGMIQGSIIIT